MAKKSSKKRNALLFFILLMLLFWCFRYILLKIEQDQALMEAQNASYKVFGIALPSHYSIYGIDVSSYQKVIYWPMVKTMKVDSIFVGFAFVKATEGLNDVDKQFTNNWQNAKQQGITRGAYHFFLATKSGERQALNFIKNVTLNSGDLPPVVDVEHLYGVNPTLFKQRLKAYLDSLEKHYKAKPIIYTYANFYNNYLASTFKNYPLWVAHYQTLGKPQVNRDWLFWQFSEHGHINGIHSFVDCNVFNGDSATFKSLLIK